MLRIPADRQPDSKAFTFLIDPDAEIQESEQCLTYGELDRRARAIAALLQRTFPETLNFRESKQHSLRALLLFPPGLDFISAFFGCLYAGVVAVPAYPPHLNRPSPRIQAIALDAQAALVLTTNKILQNQKQLFKNVPNLAALQWLSTEEINSDLAGAWRETHVSGDDLAFLQYTSGSTGNPKGVMLSHATVLHNLAVIREGFQITDGRGAFWLPNYHDMGLIGGILEPIYLGKYSVLMAPTAFPHRPVRWLEMISRYRATISGGPNFAYQMCVDKITPQECEGLDLSSWEIAFCGAEPIRPETLEAFAEKFKPYGFRRQAYHPCYGLAESTLLVTGRDGTAGPIITRFESSSPLQGRMQASAGDSQESIALVSCGRARPGHRVVIANPDTLSTCGEGEIGEIWAAGPSVAQGYWQKPEVSEKSFRAFLSDSNDGPFLRTGDLGFLYEGELYVTGRLKDLIIIRGRNYYPHDIEYTVSESHEALGMGMGAAFSIDENGEEKLVVVQEMTRSNRKTPIEEVLPAVRGAIAREHQLQLHALVLIRPFSMPRTSSGKIKRHACKEMFLEGTLRVLGKWEAAGSQQSATNAQHLKPYSPRAMESVTPIPKSDIQYWLVAYLSNLLRMDPVQIDLQRPVIEFGLDSLQTVELTRELETYLGYSLDPTLIWNYPTIEALSNYLATSWEPVMANAEVPKPQPTIRNPQSSDRIAVIGIGCRFPGTDGPEQFWQMLHDGADLISEAPGDRWQVDTYYTDGLEPVPGKMNTRWGGFLDSVDLFDADFFGIAPREATRMDPQQRLLLEVTWEALEHAGIDPTSLAGSRTGVFVGISSYDYSRRQFSHPGLIDAYAGTGNAHSIAANRISYLLDLQGPSVAIDTACSSSLVATHMAMGSLRLGETDVALAGGVNLILSPDLTITFSQARMMAADGRCKTFDAAADGYVRGEGCGILVLKRLADAERDGDPILAVLRGSAVNQDGRSNGLTAPNGLAQQAVIHRALADAGLSTEDISYVEAHGTGTRLGDPIEIHALQAVFDEKKGEPLLVGSVKTNIGHLEAAAGAAGLIKTILSLVHEEIPPHLHLHRINPNITLKNSRLVLSANAHPWPQKEKARLAGISSFGFGGTNAHVIVEEAPQEISDRGLQVVDCGSQLLMLSAKDKKALGELAQHYADYLAVNPHVNLVDLCYTAANGRARFVHRLALVAETPTEMREALLRHTNDADYADSPDPYSISALVKRQDPKSIAFLFTGQGAQYAAMGRQLYESEPVFRAALQRCEAILNKFQEEPLDFSTAEKEEPAYKWSLSELLFAEESGQGNLDQTLYTQPALFSIEYALAQMWRSWGIMPACVIGHSVGEFVAACIAEVMSLEDGLRLVSARGRLMNMLPANEGGMAAVFAPEAQVREAIAHTDGRVVIAGLNGPGSVTISGAKDALDTVLETLATGGVEAQSLVVSHAFHSPLMDPILDAFEALAKKCHFQAPRIPLVSNLTGDLLSEAPDAHYWRDHIRHPVRFAEGVEALVANGVNIFLEIGPQPHLTNMAKRIGDFGSRIVNLASLRKGRRDRQVMLDSLGQLFVLGYEPEIVNMYPDRHLQNDFQKIHLPTYPFQRERYWLDMEQDSVSKNVISFSSPSARSGDIRNQPIRLPTAVPLFESWLTFLADGDSAGLLHDNALSVAALVWGEGAHEIETFELASLPAEQLTGRVKTQTMLSAMEETALSFQAYAYNEEADSWVLIASGKLSRGQYVRTKANPVSGNGALREALQTGTPENQKALLQTYLEGMLAGILGLGTSPSSNKGRIPLDRPLDTLGLDSLMALEVKNQLEETLAINLPIVKLLQGPTIEELATELQAVQLCTKPQAAPVLSPHYDEGQPAPLSAGQQAMWVLQQLMPANIFLNVSGAAKVSGDLHIQALQNALRLLVDRHGALRTVFSIGREGDIAGQPLQTVKAAIDVPLSVVDATGWHETAKEAFIQSEAYRPFDLEHGPLLRLVLLQEGEQEYLLLLSINHLITDFWSMSLLVRDLYMLYQQETAELQSGKVAEWQGTGFRILKDPIWHSKTSEIRNPKSEIKVADYARWQAEFIESKEGQAHRAYWLQQLSGNLPRLDLPTDRPYRPVQTYIGDIVSLQFDHTLTDELKKLSQEQGVTLATTLLAAFQSLLYRYTGQEDLLTGSVIAGREHPALQELVGYLINPVALRADFSGELSFTAFLSQVKQTLLEAISHQDYPLPLIAEALVANGQLTLEPGRPPLFETMFIMQRAQVLDEQGISAFALGIPGAHLQLDGLLVDSYPMKGLPAQFDLTLMVAEVGEALTAAFHYNTHLFDASTMARMLAHFEVLLEEIVAAPDRPVNQLSMLLDAEKQQLLVDWNKTEKGYPHHKTLHELVSEKAQQFAAKTAVTYGDQSWSYSELEQHADRFAAHLRLRGVGPGTLVGLYVHRSLNMVAGLLAILKAGGAYVPLDPDFPTERIKLMIEDASLTLVVTQESLTKELAEMDLDLLCLDSKFIINSQPAESPTGKWQVVEGHSNKEHPQSDAQHATSIDPAFRAPHSALPEDLAYIIYTSGSTGRPKGVQITHRSAVNFLTSMQREPGLDANDHLLAVTTLSFDIALLELLLPLISGAQVTIASREAAMDGALLQQLLDEADITVMQATPVTWRLLLAAAWPGKEDLTVLCGGEALPPNLVEKLLPRCRALWNMYGPTETTVWSTIEHIVSSSDPIYIGRPIANTRIYLLDEKQHPVPIGAVGQLYIGGDGVARGYLNRPDLTRERFFSDPFADEGRERAQEMHGPMMYKTGDLARYLPDGRLLFLGRNDFQVKIRGYRVELGEIDAAVAHHPAVAGNITVVHEKSPGDSRLVTYWVPASKEDNPSTAEWRIFLRSYLPDYMVPTQFVAMNSLPKTPNGKIDRRALPRPLLMRDASQTEYVAPRNEMERELAAMCAEVLGLQTVGIYDNFFDLGGNSLSAARLVFWAQERFQMRIPLRLLFQQPTVAAMSQAMKTSRENGRKPDDNGQLQTITKAELQAEAEKLISDLGLEISESQANPKYTESKRLKPKTILLTGATGFLGAYLLRDLLRETDATVVCLVRASGETDGLGRIKKNMAAYDLWHGSYAGRIEVVPGDLAQPLLGLSETRFGELAESVDVVYHNGALVNFLYSYQEHKAANVLGTLEILRLAASSQTRRTFPAPVHFISTLSIFHNGQHQSRVINDSALYMEDTDLDALDLPFGGYAQSKWVGEKLVIAAMARGIPATIFRPGLISGDSESGVFPTVPDMMSTMAVACAMSGEAPDLDVKVDIIPVDFVSRAIVTLAGRPESWGQAFHLSNPRPASYGGMLKWLAELGLPLQIVPFEQWRSNMIGLALAAGGENWNPFLPLLEETSVGQIFMPAIDRQNTLAGLAAAAGENADQSITCPAVDSRLLATYLNHFQRKGLLAGNQAVSDPKPTVKSQVFD
jgi:amino acid adenylation domain-containing protein/thioester reductase-like protein